MLPSLDVSSWLLFASAGAAGDPAARVLADLAWNLIVILSAGAVAGVICRRLNISILIGYLTIGTLLGKGGLPLVSDDGHYITHLAEAGVFLLLFTIGLELSLSELAQLARWMLVGGVTQLLLVSVPAAIALVLCGLSVSGAVLMAAAVALPSRICAAMALTAAGRGTAGSCPRASRCGRAAPRCRRRP